MIDIHLDELAAPVRLDKALSEKLPEFSRSRLKSLIVEGAVLVNGRAVTSPSAKVRQGDLIKLDEPPPQDAAPRAEDIMLDIIYEDDDLLVINKAAGLVVHPGAGNADGTLVNALLHHCGDTLSGIGGVKRPGIVHRLDKDTSGLLVVAKHDKAHKKLSAQLSDRTLSRIYTALCWRVPRLPSGEIDAPIGRHPQNRLKMALNKKNGKDAVTRYRACEAFGNALCLFECTLESGRTHQIRVHMESIGHPLVGDPLYHIQLTAAQALLRKDGIEGEQAAMILNFPRQALHARKIGFVHPVSGEDMAFEAPLPEDFLKLISI